MNNYLILVRGAVGFDELSEEAKGGVYQKWMEYIKRLTESGNWLKGNPLDGSGRLLCKAKEPKEGIVGDPDIAVDGYFILQAESYDHALELCSDCPTFALDGKVEIRQCIEM